MDNEINHAYIYGIFRYCCQFTAKYPESIDEQKQQLNIPPNTYGKSVKYFDTAKRPQDEAWIGFLGKYICKRQAFHGGNVYLNFRFHTETELPIEGFWLAIYAWPIVR